jgi:hypothetical protein
MAKALISFYYGLPISCELCVIAHTKANQYTYDSVYVLLNNVLALNHRFRSHFDTFNRRPNSHHDHSQFSFDNQKKHGRSPRKLIGLMDPAVKASNSVPRRRLYNWGNYMIMCETAYLRLPNTRGFYRSYMRYNQRHTSVTAHSSLQSSGKQSKTGQKAGNAYRQEASPY